MLSKDIIRRVRRLELATRKVVASTLAGQYHSIFKGRGMTFSEVRPYQPGDEIRTIDWNVTARMQEPFVKVFTEERELTVMLLIDLSGSTSFGSNDRTKAEVAAEIAAHLAFSAIANGDRVGLLLFTDRVEKVVPPRKGRRHVLRLVSEILGAEPEGKATDLPVALETLMRVVKRRAVTFVLSDYAFEGYERTLRLASRRHDLVPIVIEDRLEQRLPPVGLMSVEDPETGALAIVDAADPRVRAAFAERQERARAERRRLFERLELDWLQLWAGEDHAGALVRFFRLRARSRGLRR